MKWISCLLNLYTVSFLYTIPFIQTTRIESDAVPDLTLDLCVLIPSCLAPRKSLPPRKAAATSPHRGAAPAVASHAFSHPILQLSHSYRLQASWSAVRVLQEGHGIRWGIMGNVEYLIGQGQLQVFCSSMQCALPGGMVLHCCPLSNT